MVKFFDGIDRGVILDSAFHISKLIFMTLPAGYALNTYVCEIKEGNDDRMNFWQSVTTFSLVFGLISSLVAVLGFFLGVTKLKHKHKNFLINISLALIFICGGTVSFGYPFTASSHEHSSSCKAIPAQPTNP